MPFAVPLETIVDGTTKRKFWFRVHKGRAGEIVMRGIDPPKTITEVGTKLILKLAAGVDLEPREIVAIKLLHGLLLMSSWRAQWQGMGHKMFVGAVDEYLHLVKRGETTKDAAVQENALRDLGLI